MENCCFTPLPEVQKQLAGFFKKNSFMHLYCLSLSSFTYVIKRGFLLFINFVFHLSFLAISLQKNLIFHYRKIFLEALISKVEFL